MTLHDSFTEIVPTADAAADVSTFPLEQPQLRTRRRGASTAGSLLPYFIAGEENRLAAFLSTSDQDVFSFGNPVLLIGPSGAGKSALGIHLAARRALRDGDASGPPKVTHLAAVDFARNFANAVENEDVARFRVELDHAAVLFIDDLQTISHKPAAQDELATRVQHRIDRLRPTVLTSRRLPSSVRRMRPALVSRSLTGLTVPIQLPGQAARRLLLKEFSLLHAVELEGVLIDEFEHGLAPALPARQLEAAVKQVNLWCRMNQTTPSSDAILACLDSVVEKRRVTLAAITTQTAKQFGLRSAELKSSSRRQRIVRARSMAMFLARQLTTESLTQIGNHFGGRDHSTVLHAIRKTTTSIEADPDLQRIADDVTEKLSG